jgi:hypothetical protein
MKSKFAGFGAEYLKTSPQQHGNMALGYHALKIDSGRDSKTFTDKFGDCEEFVATEDFADGWISKGDRLALLNSSAFNNKTTGMVCHVRATEMISKIEPYKENES